MSERPSIRDEPEDVVETPSDGIMVTLRRQRRLERVRLRRPTAR